MIIDNRVRIPTEALDPEVMRELQASFEHDNPHRDTLRRMGVPHWSEPKLIVTWTREPPLHTTGGKWLALPRGGSARAFGILEAAGVDVEIHDARVVGNPVNLPASSRQLYPHQVRIVDAALELEQCAIRAPTGSGKTDALLALASRVGLPTLVCVPTRGLQQQWVERACDMMGLERRQVGVVSGGKFRLRPLTIAVQMSVAKLAAREEFRDYFGCLLMDEIHQAAAGTYFKAIDAMPARYRVGASADVRRKDRKEFLTGDLFGEVAVDVSRKDLVESGHVLDVEVRMVPTEFRAAWYGVADVDDESDDREIDFNRVLDEMQADGDRDMLAVGIVRDEVARGQQVLVMAHRREHVLKLASVISGLGCSTGTLLGGEESRSEFEAAIRGMRDGRVQVGVGTYKAIGTGIDLPRVGVGVAVTPIASNPMFFAQVRGRLCRTAQGKTGARLYVVLDHEVFPRHAKNLASWNAQALVLVGGQWVQARQWLRGHRPSG